MNANKFVAMTLLLLGAALVDTPAQGAPPQRGETAQVAPGDDPAFDGNWRAASYTVWYKAPNRRWTDVSGLSYYHACRLRDDYLAKGWSSHIERN